MVCGAAMHTLDHFRGMREYRSGWGAGHSAPSQSLFGKAHRLSKTGFGESQPENRSFALGRTAEGARCPLLYSRALQLARTRDFEGARQAFQECVLSCPTNAKAWISWAQMEKQDKTAIANDHLNRCRKILQQGLVANPDSAKLCQSWGLLELQRGNLLAAVLLLERCVTQDPSCSPVLRWKAVQLAQQSVMTRRERAERAQAARDGALLRREQLTGHSGMSVA